MGAEMELTTSGEAPGSPEETGDRGIDGKRYNCHV